MVLIAIILAQLCAILFPDINKKSIAVLPDRHATIKKSEQKQG